MAEPVITVALCDDHAVVRSGLRRLLEDQPDLAVVGEAGTAAQATEVAREHRPDVFVMDLGLPGESGFEATRSVISASPATRVLVLTAHDDVAYLRKAFAAGAKGYLVKDIADVELAMAIRRVAGGGEFVDPSLGAALLAPESTSARPGGPGGQLSDRELETLRLIGLGYTNAQIAERLYVSVRTVETHRAHIQQKLALTTRADLVKYARDQGLLDDEPTP